MCQDHWQHEGSTEHRYNSLPFRSSHAEDWPVLAVLGAWKYSTHLCSIDWCPLLDQKNPQHEQKAIFLSCHLFRDTFPWCVLCTFIFVKGWLTFSGHVENCGKEVDVYFILPGLREDLTNWVGGKAGTIAWLTGSKRHFESHLPSCQFLFAGSGERG